MSDPVRCIGILLLSAWAYFVAFPDDAEAVVAPIRTVLDLTSLIPAALYGVAAVGIIAAAIIKTWGGRSQPPRSAANDEQASA